MTKVFRRWVCRLMVGVVVFAQMSIAAYACPAASGSAQGPSPALCAAHCDFGNQSADHASTPTAQPALITTVYSLAALTVPSVPAGARFDQPGPQSARSPPLAILHCCFRF